MTILVIYHTLGVTWINIAPESIRKSYHYAQATSAALPMVYEPLVKYQADGSVQPWLATRWRHSADGKTWWFTLRECGLLQRRTV